MRDFISATSSRRRFLSEKSVVVMISVISAIFVFMTIATYVSYRRRTRRQVEHFSHLLNEVQKLRHAERVKHAIAKAEPATKEKELLAEADDDLFMARVIDYISAHLPNGDLGINEMAESLCMSSSTFRRRMYAITKGSPKMFIRVVQINKAKELLASTTLTIKEISVQCGYKEVNSFIRAFQSDTGVTPARWRDQNKTE